MRSRGSRQLSQGLVEYSLMTVCVAFVSLAGFHALTTAQRAYLTDLPVIAPTPGVPGAILHPTLIDTPQCTPIGPVIVGSTVTCTTTVRDTFSTASDRNPPWGWVEWQLDGNPISYCRLAHLSSGATNNTCPLTYQPAGAAMVGPHTITARYGMSSPPPPAPPPPTQLLESNHIATASAPYTLNVLPNIQFTSACVNDVIGGTAAEIGHPIRCNVIVRDGSSGTYVNVPDGTPVTWTTANGNGTAGVGIFTCAIPAPPYPGPGGYNSVSHTAVPDVYTDHTACPQPIIAPIGSVSFTCVTTGGQCSVLYRRLYDNGYGGVGPTPPLVLGAMGSTYSFALPNVTYSGQLHQTQGTVVCTSGQGGVNVFNSPVTFRNATFPSTQSIDVHGGVVGGTGSVPLTCTAAVWDVRSSPVFDYGVPSAPGNTSNPNFGDAYPPMGPVSFRQNATPVGNCTLMRVDMVSLPAPGQATGQAPFLSTCDFNLTVTGTITDFFAGPRAPVTVGFSYNGEPTPSPGHGPLDCGSAPAACVRVNFVSP